MKLCALAAALLWAFPQVAAAQVAILHIQVVEGEGAVNTPGARNARPLAVEVTDETGKPVEGAAVTFHLPEEGPGGTFVNGLRTEVTLTDARGRAGVRTLQPNRTPGRFQIRIVAAKEQARAGTVSFQYISEAPTGRPSAQASTASSGAPPRHGPLVSRRTLKWVAVAVLAGGAAAAGALAAGRSSGSGSTASSSTAATTSTALTVTLGSPTLTVSKP